MRSLQHVYVLPLTKEPKTTAFTYRFTQILKASQDAAALQDHKPAMTTGVGPKSLLQTYPFSNWNSFICCNPGWLSVSTKQSGLCQISNFTLPMAWLTLKLLSQQTWQLDLERPWILRKPTTYLTCLKIGGCCLFQVVIPDSMPALTLTGDRVSSTYVYQIQPIPCQSQCWLWSWCQ